ncbi:ribonuclease H-like domain-containing protein [Mycena metata]|uniref:ribonuclease H n=1 Tax=Mycena metata TaxID=1033252 RepID=A0AAD7IA35_9AGAR|nr:ribonuclease H-like domain-containing protein [Mycena metata]
MYFHPEFERLFFPPDPYGHRISTCDYCNRFIANHGSPCHRHLFVFVDGACARNGQPDARSGIGCAMGTSRADQLSAPVTEAMDPSPRRTSQRAELLAAIHGLEMLVQANVEYREDCSGLMCANPDIDYTVVGDSEYMVKGITEWVPQWKRTGWISMRDGGVPRNVDLFKRLDAIVSEYENQGITIRFLHVGRNFNRLADGLATRAIPASS